LQRKQFDVSRVSAAFLLAARFTLTSPIQEHSPTPKPDNSSVAAVIREGTTVLSIGTVLMFFAAYQMLITGSSRLTSTSKLPFVSIKHNLGTILSLTWPDTSMSETKSEKSLT